MLAGITHRQIDKLNVVFPKNGNVKAEPQYEANRDCLAPKSEICFGETDGLRVLYLS
jgi:hypothetical protein